MTSGFGAREQSRAEKTCGRANTLVDLCNSRAGSLWPLLGARRKMAGLVWKSHRMENGHERKPGACRFFPLVVSYHLCNHLANGRRARTMEGLFRVVRLLLLQPAATRWSAAELY
jgi:hypothetical protein